MSQEASTPAHLEVSLSAHYDAPKARDNVLGNGSRDGCFWEGAHAGAVELELHDGRNRKYQTLTNAENNRPIQLLIPTKTHHSRSDHDLGAFFFIETVPHTLEKSQVHMITHTHVYIYIYLERERERDVHRAILTQLIRCRGPSESSGRKRLL